MPSIKELQDGHVAYELSCFDRLYLNLRIPMLCSLGGMAAFLCKLLGEKIPLANKFKPMRDRFVSAVEAFAKENGLEVHRFSKSEDKEEVARKHFEAMDSPRPGVFFIGKAPQRL